MRQIHNYPRKKVPMLVLSRKLFEEITIGVQGLPFFLNPRGILVHRVRCVETFSRDSRESHHAVGYLCGNGCTFELGNEDAKFFDDPPKDRLVCAFCEAKAERMGQPSSDSLAGRHVHRGVLKAHRVCCEGSK